MTRSSIICKLEIMKLRNSTAVCVLFLFTIWKLSATAQTVCSFRNSNNHDPQSSSSTFRVLPRAEQDSLTLRHDPQLLEVVAKYGESVVARLNETSQTAIVQEGVHIKMDCLPWLCKTVGEGSIIRWFKRRFRVDQNSGIVQSIHNATIVENIDNHIQVGGDRNRWLNITHTMLASADADHGEYICSVCSNEGASFADCQNASLTLYIIGAPPIIDKHTGSSSPSTVISDTPVYDIGADFCLQRNTNTSVALRCNLLQTNHSSPVPKPIRIWHKDGDLLSNGTNIFQTFFRERKLLILGVLTPPNFILLGSAFSVLFLNTSVDNVTTSDLLEDDVPIEVARDMLFDLLLGEFTCSVQNVYGMDTATTVIQECDTPSPNVKTKFMTSVPRKNGTTLDENGTEKSLQPHDAIVCPLEVDSYYGIQWKSTPAATTVVEDCGDEYTGIAKRVCDFNGTWLVPDVLECQKKSFASVLNQANDVFKSNSTEVPKLQHALDVTEELSILTNPVNTSTSIFPQDLNTTVYILENTVDLLLEADKMKFEPIINESSAVIDVASNILEDSNNVGIQTLQEQNPLFSQTLLNTIERYGFYVAQTATANNMNRSNVTITTKNIALKAETVDMTESHSVNVSFFSTPVQFPASIQLPVNLLMSKTNRSVLPIANILIHNLQQYLPLSSLDNTTAPYPVSAILSSQVAINEGSFQSLDEPVVMNFTVDIKKDQDLTCVFWDYTNTVGSGGWSTDNVTTVISSTYENKTTVKCSSTHLTSFAVLVNVAGNRDDIVSKSPLSYVSYIGLALSLACLLPTIIFFLTFGKQLLTEVHYFVHLNLAIALFFANLLFVAGSETATASKTACQIVAGLLHYFYLAVFCWMLCEGVMLYLMLVVVFSELSKKWWFFLLLGWLPPFVFVVIGGASVGEKYGLSDNKQFCWLSTSTALWTFVVPMLAIMLANTIFLILILVTLCRKYKKKRHNNDKEKGHRTAITTVKASIILLPLLGLTWVIGLFFANTDTTAFAWIFTGINSLQGVFIFVFHVLRNERIWGRIKKRCLSFRSTSSHTASVATQVQHRTSIKHTKRRFDTQTSDIVTTMSSGSTLVLNGAGTQGETDTAHQSH